MPTLCARTCLQGAGFDGDSSAAAEGQKTSRVLERRELYAVHNFAGLQRHAALHGIVF